MRVAFFAATLAATMVSAYAADPLGNAAGTGVGSTGTVNQTFRGVVTVLDGRTLRYYRTGQKVRIAGIESCNLPQWAFERSGYPYPCGPLGKAYLKRLIRRSSVTCNSYAVDRDGVPLAQCTVDGENLATHIAAAGLAITDPSEAVPASDATRTAEALALENGFGLNSTTFLDPQDWRRRAGDKTLGRRPFRDRNMIADNVGRVYEPVEPENPALDSNY